ncbi:putative sensor histidine kinase pdtaS [Fundidesulfovibrio magnetotacticus]|uniref:histidine kinase n=1 Tax=Fundidesulfovibrio magnetotacticus TaxID=2730080 RepID=A0A6V8LUZ9_9BACT|nr:histidine kinase dimerization/phosphoacceptor domain -containing protein [Fundidesulfovibrio magnetotacticus]GFK93939.1 putative sensor histidine kinase pdtaS [Fundidesulfovibrio magnetotacticus]
METQGLSRIIQGSVLRRTLAPALAGLAFLAVFLLDQQKEAVEARNGQFAHTMAVYVDKHLDEAYRALERLAPEVGQSQGQGRSLRELMGMLPFFNRLMLLDARRTVLDVWPAGGRGQEYPVRLAEQERGRLLLSRPIPSSRGGDISVVVAVRMAGGGVLAAEVDLRALASHMTELSVAMGGDVIVCDGYGNLVCHPDVAQVARQGNMGDSPLFLAMKRGGRSLVYEEDGVFYVGSGAHVPEMGWMVFVRTQAVRALAPAALPVSVGAAAMAAALVGIMLSLRGRLTKHVARPLADVAGRLDVLEPGEVYRAGEAPAFRELGRFEQALQEMTGRIAQGEERLRASLAEKEVLLREIHHRVKNNLQIISSLLYLQSEHIDDPKTLDAFLSSRERIACMALVHEALYRSENLDDVWFGEYARQLVSRLMSSLCARPDVHYTVEADDVRLSIAQAVPLGLILNELVTNAMKHAFPGGRGGSLNLRVRQVDTTVMLHIDDDGVGIPEGFDPETTSTLGMQLVVQLTRQLRGELIVGKGRKGASFSITFPIKGTNCHVRQSHDR